MILELHDQSISCSIIPLSCQACFFSQAVSSTIMLSSNHLISPVLSLEVILIAGDSHTLSYYLHDSEGDVEIASGTSLAQSIYSLAPPDYLLTHAQNQLQKISKAVNLNFVESFDPNLADISFYWDREIELNDSLGGTYGLTRLNYSQQPKRSGLKSSLMVHSSISMAPISIPMYSTTSFYTLLVLSILLTPVMVIFI